MTEVDRHTATETDVFANGANVSSSVFHAIQSSRGPAGCNWVGFYFCRSLLPPSPPGKQVLLLGPFQGKPACRRINFEEGVCGAAARTKTAQLVHDVHKFPGHIACDSASNSEVSSIHAGARWSRFRSGATRHTSVP